MFLRSLTLRGFKSFADKTVLEFTPGIGGIVGPNGSGKSNLVDAIAWVLGEQGPRALRGAQMADVIFAGSPKRPALGMAEVTLVIDNSAGLIPVPMTEIQISRVVYRSGESQYLIGGQPVRLMDIQELLSDTGIGRALHTVVGQGNLEDVLTSRPEERRQFIEEAAGIAKHRKRKERAQRKLASLDQDLLRLQDVMNELKRQLKPLKQQAEMARRHEGFTQEADALGWRLAAARLRDLERERDRRRSTWEEGRARRQEAEDRLRSLDADIAALGTRLAETEERLRAAEQEEAAAIRARSAAETALRQAVAAEGEARARLAEESGRSGRLFSLEEEVSRTGEALAETRRQMDEREAESLGAERAYETAVRTRHEAEDERRRAHETTAARRAEQSALRRALESAEGERERLSATLEDVAGREREAAERRRELEREVERLDAQQSPHTDRQRAIEREQKELADAIAELEERERGLEARRQALEARAGALGSTPGRRFLERRGGRAAGLVGDLLRPKAGMERAVAAALGSLADAVVYPDQDQAVADAAEGGGATLAVGGGEPPAHAQQTLPNERPLLGAVNPDPRVRSLVAAVLRHVYLADDAAQALEKHRANPGASFVTPDGILVGRRVVRTAPRPTEDEAAIRREAEQVARDLAGVRSHLSGRRGERDRLEEESSELAERLRETDHGLTAASERLAAAGAERAALEREREVLAERLVRVEESVRAAREALSQLPAEAEEPAALPEAPEPPMGLRVEVEALRRERSRLETGLARTREELERLRTEDPATLRAAAERATGVRQTAERALEEAEARAAAATPARETASGEAAGARAAEVSANEGWREAATLLERLRDEYEEEDQVRRDVERRIAEGERVLREGHHKEPAEAIATLTPEDTVESIQKRADLVVRRLALLGRVNLVADDEYHALQERHDFLQREIDDVKAARRDLQEVVRDVDRKIQEIFAAAYEDVAAEFERLFAIVFPGGEGKLILTDPGDLLASGIDIEARPGRKKVKRLSLLSGGERALTALTFLFAIFRARPSPFYLLDEVEASLDDVNLHRFIELVRGFAETSQVLLVTHQKRTMEAADVLYGVSMGQSGASAVITERISEAVPNRA